jgi:hypothetical protein
MTAPHVGRKYPCDQCTYMATAPNALKRHIQSIHELVKHPCDSCSYRQVLDPDLELPVVRSSVAPALAPAPAQAPASNKFYKMP